jgi:hypothetical protein
MTSKTTRIARAGLRWLRRYLPAELAATPCALLAGLTAWQLSASPALAALAATWGENVGFYGVMLGRELARSRSLCALPAVVRGLVLEFGPAEALDSLLLRPASVYAGLALAPHPALGMIAGKLFADVGFYAPAIVSHELQRWWARSSRAARARVVRRLLPAVGVLACLSLASASFAQDLTGTWQGTPICKDQRSKSVGHTTGPLLVTQPNGPCQSPLRT